METVARNIAIPCRVVRAVGNGRSLHKCIGVEIAIQATLSTPGREGAGTTRSRRKVGGHQVGTAKVTIRTAASGIHHSERRTGLESKHTTELPVTQRPPG